MAGHVLKIILDNTHPPVWRRVIVPEKITFADLHEIIQILFGWDDYHLHDFQIPSRHISIDMGESFFDSSHYTENKTLLEQFFPEIGRIRYTYDFGDQWTHTIMYENTDKSYTKRHASFLKAKGDNFSEDSGGIWLHCEFGENRVPFDEITVSQRLESLIFPVRNNVYDTPRDLSEEGFEDLLNKDLTEEEIQAVADDFLKYLHDFLKKYPPDAPDTLGGSMDNPDMSFLTDAPDMDFLTNTPDIDFLNKKTKQSQLSKKIDLWKDFARYGSSDSIIVIAPGSRTNAELLYALNRTEAADYCKYLRIPVKNGCTKKQMTDAVGKAFQEHPEYLLYVLTEENYKELSRFMKLPYGTVSEQPQTETMVRALGLGLVDLTVSQNCIYCKAVETDVLQYQQQKHLDGTFIFRFTLSAETFRGGISRNAGESVHFHYELPDSS